MRPMPSPRPRRPAVACTVPGVAAVCCMAAVCGAPRAALGAEERIEIRTSSRLRHVPGSWSYLDVLATNPTDADGEALVVVSFPHADGRQYARRVWVPARGERTTWLPIRVPPDLPPDASLVTVMPMSVMTLDGAASGDELTRSDAGAGFVSGDLIRLSDDSIRSASYLERQVLDDADDVEIRNDQWLRTLAVARTATQLSPAINDLPDDFLVPSPTVLRGLDQILVASDRIADDTAGAVALRGWIRDGGRLWIALDAVRPETVTTLLGHDCRIEVVDRVQLDRFVIDAAAEDGTPLHELCEHDDPVDFVRVVTSHPGVVARIDGWPAAIEVPYGQGDVLLTTLGPRGWLAPGDPPPAARPAEGPLAEGPAPDRRRATATLTALASRLLHLRSGRLDPVRLHRELEQRVGAVVPRRALAGWVLGGFCAALVAAALVLASRGTIAGLGLVVPAAAAAATGLMLAVGASGSRGVPAQIATAEVVRVAPATAETTADGLAAVYDTRERPVEWAADARHWTLPRVQRGQPGGRLLFGDDDALRVTQLTTHARSIDRVSLNGTGWVRDARAHARFGPEGLAGRLRVEGYPPAADGGDPFVIVSPSPALGVRLESDGSFTAPAEGLLAADTFAAAGLLSEQSMWRQEVLRTVLAIPGGAVEDGGRPTPRVDPEAEPPPLQGRPWLCYWSDPATTPWGFPGGFTDRRGVLVVADLDLDRTPSGERFRIPPPFLRTTAVKGATGRSAAFDARTGRWIRGLSRPTETMLRFQIPPQVVPCRIGGARLEIRGSAPARVLTVAAIADGREVGEQRFVSPEGVRVVEFSGEQLQPDDAWGLTFRVSVGEAQREGRPGDDDVELTETWQIDHVHLTLDGTTE